MTTMVIVTLLVIFGAALMGKMLMDMFPGSIFNAFNKEEAEESTPAE